MEQKGLPVRTITRLLVAATLVAVLPLSAASAVPVTHEIAVAAGETQTWQGTARTGTNLNYNGLASQLDPILGSARTCSTDPRNMCEYALVAVTNPVPEDDADGKLRKTMTVTLNGYSPESPATDVALTVYETDETGSTRGSELATSDNTDVPDPDEQVSVSVTTTLDEPTQYYLVEVAYFIGVNSSYTGTVRF